MEVAPTSPEMFGYWAAKQRTPHVCGRVVLYCASVGIYMRGCSKHDNVALKGAVCGSVSEYFFTGQHQILLFKPVLFSLIGRPLKQTNCQDLRTLLQGSLAAGSRRGLLGRCSEGDSEHVPEL